MPDHTPGPWYVREPDNDEHTEVYAEATGIVCFPEPNDAYLIAAAPEMLAALKQAVSLLSYASQDGGIYGCNADEWFGMEQSCRAAIAKTEGRDG